MNTKNFLRIGVFYDGTFFTKAQNYFWGQKYGWLSFQEFHKLLENYIRTKEQGHSSYKVVYSAWYQGLFTSTNADEKCTIRKGLIGNAFVCIVFQEQGANFSPDFISGKVTQIYITVQPTIKDEKLHYKVK